MFHSIDQVVLKCLKRMFMFLVKMLLNTNILPKAFMSLKIKTSEMTYLAHFFNRVSISRKHI